MFRKQHLDTVLKQSEQNYCRLPYSRSSTDIELVFSGEMSKSPRDCVLCYRDTIALKTPKSREKNEGRRYFDYCEITTTEYKWTTILTTVRKMSSLVREPLTLMVTWYLRGCNTKVHVHRPPAVTLNKTPEEFHISTGLR